MVVHKVGGGVVVEVTTLHLLFTSLVKRVNYALLG